MIIVAKELTMIPLGRKKILSKTCKESVKKLTLKEATLKNSIINWML